MEDQLDKHNLTRSYLCQVMLEVVGAVATVAAVGVVGEVVATMVVGEVIAAMVMGEVVVEDMLEDLKAGQKDRMIRISTRKFFSVGTGRLGN